MQKDIIDCNFSDRLQVISISNYAGAIARIVGLYQNAAMKPKHHQVLSALSINRRFSDHRIIKKTIQRLGIKLEQRLRRLLIAMQIRSNMWEQGNFEEKECNDAYLLISVHRNSLWLIKREI